MTRAPARLFAPIALLLLAAGCGGGDEASDQNVAIDAPDAAIQPIEAALKAGDGAARGRTVLSEEPSGVMVSVDAAGLEPGAHGLHLHMTGTCDGPDFKSAGAHWNPTGRQHGRDNPQGSHLGDLANLAVGDDGKGSAKFLVSGARLSGEGGLIDADGAALVIHAKPDDYKTDPSGDSGDRVACAAFSAP